MMDKIHTVFSLSISRTWTAKTAYLHVPDQEVLFPAEEPACLTVAPPLCPSQQLYCQCWWAT